MYFFFRQNTPFQVESDNNIENDEDSYVEHSRTNSSIEENNLDAWIEDATEIDGVSEGLEEGMIELILNKDLPPKNTFDSDLKEKDTLIKQDSLESEVKSVHTLDGDVALI